MARRGGRRKQHEHEHEQDSLPPFRKKKGRLSHTTNAEEEEDAFTEDLDDDIDKFHKGTDKILLDVDDDNELSEGDMEQPVFNLKGESSEDDDVATDDDELDEEKLSGLAAKMAKQAKLLRQRTSLMVDEEDEEEGEEKNDKKAPWGKRKKMYYSADNVDYELQSSDEEAPVEEEAEALRLQRLKAASLRPEDFELSDEDDDGADGLPDENERSLQEVVERRESKSDKNIIPKGWRIGVSSEDVNILIEEVKKDVSALSKEEQMNVVMSDAPELVGLLAELRESLDELHKKVEPLLEKIKRSDTASREGHLFLETKRILLLSYIQAIVFYLHMKSEGRSVRDHPVIARLVDIRTLLEKLQPIDKKLQTQISELMNLNIESLGMKGIINNGDVNNKSIIGVVMQQMAKSQENEGSLKQQQTSLQRKDEDTQTPKSTLPNGNGASIKSAKKSQCEMVHFEADNRTKFLKNGETNELTYCEEDEILPDNKSLHKIISNKMPKKRKHIASGDMDLPAREELGERRRKHEVQRIPLRPEDSDETNEQGYLQLEEDEFYQQAKQLKVAKLAAKQKTNLRTPMPEPVVEEVGKRHITYQMEKNKGLTPHRKKLTKNPRKKYKLKHEKAVIRRKGQVREVKLLNGAYGGETSGIRTAISRSVRFNS